MIRTRVGYTGGTTANPTYHNLADHSETIQIDYDPGQISYKELLDIFFDAIIWSGFISITQYTILTRRNKRINHAERNDIGGAVIIKTCFKFRTNNPKIID